MSGESTAEPFQAVGRGFDSRLPLQNLKQTRIDKNDGIPAGADCGHKDRRFRAVEVALDRIFSSAAVEKFYGKLQSRTVYVREFEKILDLGILESVDSGLAKSGKTAKALYESLTVSDQALMREFYLERIEKVDTKVRQKYQKLYRYY